MSTLAYSIQKRDRCRICSALGPRPFLEFRAVPFTDGFVRPRDKGSEFMAPLSIYWCSNCGVAQTQHDVEVSEYYRDYRYTVSQSAFANRFMARLAEESFRRFGLLPGDTVIEIGSGDGRQLQQFKALGARVFGFEPSEELTRVSLDSGVPVARCLFSDQAASEIPGAILPARVILLTYTFDHLPDPMPFLAAVKQVIDPARGVLLLEVHDLRRIMERRETCLFEHEHSIYTTEASMRRLLSRAGFRLVTTNLVPDDERRGNSLLVAAVPEGTSVYHPDTFDDSAFDRFDRWETYAGFGAKVERSYERFRNYVRSRRSVGKRIAGYGAGGRGVMTIAMADLNADDIEFLCDLNPSLHGYLAPGSHVPIVGPGVLDDEPVDEVIIFSFGYIAEISGQLEGYVSRGGRMVSMLDLL